MSQYKKDFLERKGKILSLMEEMKEFYVAKDDAREVSIVESWMKNLNENEFSIVVVGEFSAGKSTFLNALMGDKLLPSYTKETTATINFLRHKEKNGGQVGGCVHYRDGHTESFTDISEATIKRYVSTDSDVAVANDVEYLELFLDSDFLKDNVTLVDSPGLNGVADKHKDITEEQIEKSSAGIFMFRAEQPGSKSDFDFLKNLKEKVNTVFYLINKIDRIKAYEGESVESVIQHIKESYKGQFPSENSIPEIRGISAEYALVARSGIGKELYSDKSAEELEENSRLKPFEERLMRFLTQGEKGRMLLIDPVRKMYNKLSVEKANLESNKADLEGSTDSDDINTKIMEIREQKESLEKKIAESKRELGSEVKGLREEADEFLNAEIEKLKNKYISKLENWDELKDIENFEANINSRLSSDLIRINNDLSDRLQDCAQDIIASKYYDIADKINIDGENLKCDIKLQEKYEFNEADINIGIEKYEERKAESEKKIHELEKKLEETELSGIKRRSIERERKRIEEAIDDVNEEKKLFASMYGNPPAPERYTETKDEKVIPGGLLGAVRFLLMGKKRITKEEVKFDRTACDEYIAREEQLKKELNDKLTALENKRNGINLTGKSEDEINFEKISIQKMIDEAKAEYEVARQEFKRNVEKKEARAIREKRNNINEFMDDISTKMRKEYRTAIRDKEKIIINVISSAISFEVQRQLDEKEESLRLLDSQLKSSVDERNSIIAKVMSDIDAVQEMLSKTIELEAELEGIEEDKIESVLL